MKQPSVHGESTPAIGGVGSGSLTSHRGGRQRSDLRPQLDRRVMTTDGGSLASTPTGQGRVPRRQGVRPVAKVPEPEPIIIGSGGKPASVDLDAESAHILVNASIGGGTLANLRCITCQMLHHGSQVFILDYKRIFHLWARAAERRLLCRDPRRPDPARLGRPDTSGPARPARGVALNGRRRNTVMVRLPIRGDEEPHHDVVDRGVCQDSSLWSERCRMSCSRADWPRGRLLVTGVLGAAAERCWAP